MRAPCVALRPTSLSLDPARLKQRVDGAPAIALRRGTLTLAGGRSFPIIGRGVAQADEEACLVATAEAIERAAVHADPPGRIAWMVGANGSESWQTRAEASNGAGEVWVELAQIMPSARAPQARSGPRAAMGVAAHPDPGVAQQKAMDEAIERAALHDFWGNVGDPCFAFRELESDTPLITTLNTLGYGVHAASWEWIGRAVAVVFLIARDELQDGPMLIAGAGCASEPAAAETSACNEAFAQLINAAELMLSGVDRAALEREEPRCMYWRAEPAKALLAHLARKSGPTQSVRSRAHADAIVLNRIAPAPYADWSVRQVVLPALPAIAIDTVGPAGPSPF